MRFTEIDVFGVYVAPMSLMMVVAWLVTVALRGAAAKKYQERRQVTQNVGHMLVDLPTGCEFGAKKNSKGYKGFARLAADCRYRRHMSPRAIPPSMADSGSLALPAGLAMLAFAMGFAAEPEDGSH